MKRHSVTLKLFVFTLVIFSLFLGIFMAAQSVFFKSFYLNMKEKNLEKSLEAFSEQYQGAKWSGTDITRSINKFADENNAQLALLDDKGAVKYAPDYKIVLKKSDGGTLTLPLDNIVYMKGFEDLDLAVGSEIEVDGLFNGDESEVLLLSGIKSGGLEWQNSTATTTTAAAGGKLLLPYGSTTASSANVATVTAAGSSSQASASSKPTVNSAASPLKIFTATLTPIPGSLKIDYKNVKGTITELDLPSQVEQMTNYSKDLLYSAINYYNGLTLLKKEKAEPGKLQNLHYQDPSTGLDNIIVAKPLYSGDKLTGYAFSVSSLQPVGEAVDVLKGYYFYAFFAALLLIAALALFFSRIITKPLIKMNQVAVRMAGFDFSEEVAARSDDELGSLAKSLNLLSKNLGSSLSELKEANGKLMLDIEKEKKLEQMLKEFVASVSHELKTPLGIIRGFAEGLKDNIAENKKEHYVDVILGEIESMDGLVLDLLDLAKLESEAYRLSPENFSVLEVERSIEDKLSAKIDGKSLKIEHICEGQSLEVHADEARICQVVTNILDNAIRHTPEGGTIAVKAEERGADVLVSIENSGSHLEDEDLTRVFEKFYRAEKSRDRRTGGTGLGLSIVKNILELHNSSFGCENTAGGVRFFFTLAKPAQGIDGSD